MQYKYKVTNEYYPAQYINILKTLDEQFITKEDYCHV